MSDKKDKTSGALLHRDKMNPYTSLYVPRIDEAIGEYVRRMSVHLDSWVTVGWHPEYTQVPSDCGWNLVLACRHGLVFVNTPNPKFFDNSRDWRQGRAWDITEVLGTVNECDFGMATGNPMPSCPEELVSELLKMGKYFKYLGGETIFVYWERGACEAQEVKLTFPCKMFNQVI